MIVFLSLLRVSQHLWQQKTGVKQNTTPNHRQLNKNKNRSWLIMCWTAVNILYLLTFSNEWWQKRWGANEKVVTYSSTSVTGATSDANVRYIYASNRCRKFVQQLQTDVAVSKSDWNTGFAHPVRMSWMNHWRRGSGPSRTGLWTHINNMLLRELIYFMWLIAIKLTLLCDLMTNPAIKRDISIT